MPWREASDGAVLLMLFPLFHRCNCARNPYACCSIQDTSLRLEFPAEIDILLSISISYEYASMPWMPHVCAASSSGLFAKRYSGVSFDPERSVAQEQVLALAEAARRPVTTISPGAT